MLRPLSILFASLWLATAAAQKFNIIFHDKSFLCIGYLFLPLSFSSFALKKISVSYRQNFVFQLWAVHPAIVRCTAHSRELFVPQLRDEVLLLTKIQKQ